jgi:hypothetical protein
LDGQDDRKIGAIPWHRPTDPEMTATALKSRFAADFLQEQQKTPDRGLPGVAPGDPPQ